MTEERQYILSRDGKEIMRGDEAAILNYIHKRHSCSAHHALLYEGYEVEPVDERGESVYMDNLLEEVAVKIHKCKFCGRPSAIEGSCNQCWALLARLEVFLMNQNGVAVVEALLKTAKFALDKEQGCDKMGSKTSEEEENDS